MRPLRRSSSTRFFCAAGICGLVKKSFSAAVVEQRLQRLRLVVDLLHPPALQGHLEQRFGVALGDRTVHLSRPFGSRASGRR